MYVCTVHTILLSPACSSPNVPVTPHPLPNQSPFIIIESSAMLAAPIEIIRDTLEEYHLLVA